MSGDGRRSARRRVRLCRRFRLGMRLPVTCFELTSRLTCCTFQTLLLHRKTLLLYSLFLLDIGGEEDTESIFSKTQRAEPHGSRRVTTFMSLFIFILEFVRVCCTSMLLGTAGLCFVAFAGGGVGCRTEGGRKEGLQNRGLYRGRGGFGRRRRGERRNFEQGILGDVWRCIYLNLLSCGVRCGKKRGESTDISWTTFMMEWGGVGRGV